MNLKYSIEKINKIIIIFPKNSGMYVVIFVVFMISNIESQETYFTQEYYTKFKYNHYSQLLKFNVKRGSYVNRSFSLKDGRKN